MAENNPNQEFKEFKFNIVREYFDGNTSSYKTDSIYCFGLQRVCRINTNKNIIANGIQYCYTKVSEDGSITDPIDYPIACVSDDYVLESIENFQGIPTKDSNDILTYDDTENGTYEIRVNYIKSLNITISTEITTTPIEVMSSENNSPKNLPGIYKTCGAYKLTIGGSDFRNYDYPYAEFKCDIDSVKYDIVEEIIKNNLTNNPNNLYGETGFKISLYAVDAYSNNEFPYRYKFEEIEVYDKDAQIKTADATSITYEINRHTDNYKFKIVYQNDPTIQSFRMIDNLGVHNISPVYDYAGAGALVRSRDDHYCPYKTEIIDNSYGTVYINDDVDKGGRKYDNLECVQVQHVISDVKFPDVIIKNETGGLVDPFEVYLSYYNNNDKIPEKKQVSANKFLKIDVSENNGSIQNNRVLKFNADEYITGWENTFKGVNPTDGNTKCIHNSILVVGYNGEENWESTRRALQFELIDKKDNKVKAVYFAPWDHKKQEISAYSIYCNKNIKEGDEFIWDMTDNYFNVHDIYSYKIIKIKVVGKTKDKYESFKYDE